MATFHSSSTNQKDVAPHLYPGSSVPGNLLYLNYSSSGSYSGTLAGTNHSQQNCIQLHIPPTMVSQDSSIGGGDFVSSRLVEHTYNIWREGKNDMFMPMNGADDLVRSSVTVDPLMDLPSHLGILSGQDLSLQQSNVLAMQGQGLSLSLGTQMPVSSFQHQPGSSDICFLGSHQSTLVNDGSCTKDSSAVKHMNSNSPPCGLLSITSSVSNSKYLKAAQQLLDEVVNVWRALKHKADKSQSAHTSTGTAGCKDNDGGSKTDENPSNPQESTNNSSVELSPSERQDLQNKVTKLLAMLDEVDQRYKQYYHQMQMVVSSFDAVAGSGAARPYTALALQTISRHFRCLRDAISGHIRTTRKSLGDQDSTLTKGVGISRLRYIDQHLRQQRAMQQFGLMQPHAWRPQRGLPETSVSILRAWLFEHFLHPYPKDSEKLMLARQTGLTRSQVSNWFINARVRLWKPMIEEMYKEETGDAEMDSNSSSENILKSREEMRSPEDREDLQSPISERYLTNQYKDSSKSNLIGDMVMGSSFHIENVEETYDNGDGRFIAAYHMPELGRRYGNEAVSLTLGLQHRDGSNGQQSFLAGRGEEIYGSPPPIGTDATNYEYMNQPHRFGSPHLLHDFVA